MSVPYINIRNINWGDTDAANIAYTVRFFDFCMEAIEGWFRDICDTDWYVLNMDRAMGTPFVNINIDILAPLTPRYSLNTYVLIEKLGNASLIFRLKGIRSDEVQSFDASFTCCFVNNKDMVSVPIPKDIRHKIEEYIQAGGGSGEKVHLS